MIKKIIILVALIVSATLSQEISFKKLVEHVNATSPKILQQKINTKLSRVRLESVQSQYYPTFNLGATSEYSHKYNQSYTPSSVGDNSLTQSTQYQTSTVISMNYDLFRFGATALHVEAAHKEIDSSLANECVVNEEILTELLETYQKARIANIKLYYYKKIKKAYEELYRNAKRLYAYGSLRQTEVSSYALQIADLVANAAQTREEKNSALGHLYYLSGVKIDTLNQLTPLHVKDSDEDLPSFEQSTQYKKIQAQIKQKEALLKAEQKAYYPILALYGKYDLYGSDLDTYSNSIDNLDKNGYRFGLSISWNIFDGFKREANIKTRLLELKNAKIALEDVKREYEKDKMILNTQIKNLKDRVVVSKQAADVSNDLASMSNRLHKSGESDKLSSIKSQITFYQNLLKTKEAQEMLETTKMKKMIIAQKENRCAVH